MWSVVRFINLMSKFRPYVYTLNNYTEQEEKEVQSLPATYHVYGRETGESGTPHLQGFIYFPNKRSFEAVKKLIPRAHWEVARDLGRAISYSKKDGNVWESGVPPHAAVGRPKEAVRAERNKRLRESSLEELVASGDINIMDVRRLKNARMDLDQEGQALQTEDVRGVWFYGPPGVGKSHKARNDYPDAYIKAQNKWFDGYIGQENILLDDFDCKELGHYLKIWADKWSCSGEIKGGKVNLRHKAFIITSNYHPDELWEGHMLEAIKRRFKITHFNKIQ